MAKIGALIAAALGAGNSFDVKAIQERTRIGDRSLRAFIRRARRGGGNHGRFTHALRAKFAKNALARYGLDVLGPDGKPDPDTVRVMRNARKQERRNAR